MLIGIIITNGEEDMANAWFRLYAEFATDPKVQRLSEVDQRRYIMLLCLRCSNENVTLQDDDITFQLRINSDDWNSTKKTLISKNLITKDNKPVAWEKRQFVSDSSTARVRRHRNVSVTANETFQKRSGNGTDTDSDSDSDTDPETDLFSQNQTKQEVLYDSSKTSQLAEVDLFSNSSNIVQISNKRDFNSEALEVFNFWIDTFGKSKIKTEFSEKRKRKILQRLNGKYTVEDLKLAILGCRNSEFHQGQNDTGTIYDDLELICRSPEYTDRFIRLNSKIIKKTKSQLRQQKIDDAFKNFMTRGEI